MDRRSRTASVRVLRSELAQAPVRHAVCRYMVSSAAATCGRRYAANPHDRSAGGAGRPVSRVAGVRALPTGGERSVSDLVDVAEVEPLAPGLNMSGVIGIAGTQGCVSRLMRPQVSSLRWHALRITAIQSPTRPNQSCSVEVARSMSWRRSCLAKRSLAPLRRPHARCCASTRSASCASHRYGVLSGIRMGNPVRRSRLPFGTRAGIFYVQTVCERSSALGICAA